MSASIGNLAPAMDTLTNLAYQFGPFFFALLFALVITRTARKWYASAPEHSDDKSTYRIYFFASWAFGMLLVATSVLWWIRSQWLDPPHAFVGKIVNLQPNQELGAISEDQDFWSRLWAHQGLAADQSKDYAFVILSHRPLYRGETFRFNYWEGATGGGIGQSPPPTATILVRVADPTAFPQKYTLQKDHGGVIEAVPYD